MSLNTAIVALGILLVYHGTIAKRPPSQGSKVNRVKGQQETELALDDSSLSLRIEHSVGRGNEFYTRGTLHLKSLKSSPAPSSFQQVSLPPSNLTSLRLAAKYGGYYFIRARSKFTDLLSDSSESSQGDYVVTFISACALVNAELSDLITVNGDGQGNVIGLTLTTPVVVTGMDCEDADEARLPDQFNSSVFVDNGMVGPVPNTQGYFQKAEAEKRDNKDGKDNRSFLQKYWLYIVIGFVIFTFVNNAAGAAGGGGGGGGGGGQ